MRWALSLVAPLFLSLGGALDVRSESLPQSSDAALPVRLRLLPLPTLPFTNSLFLEIHRSPNHVTISALTRRETWFGTSVAAVGDVDGNGYGDLLIGAPYFQSGRNIRAGAVALVLGTATGLVANAGWSFDGEQGNRQLGSVVAGGRDINGDRLPDIVVATRHRLSSGVNRGGLNVFYGSSNLISTNRDWSYLPESWSGQIGDSVVLADVNADGFADLIAGASRHTEKVAHEGAVYQFLGGPRGLESTPSLIIPGEGTNAAFGSSLAAPGDVNGDGFPDILVGAPSFPLGTSAVGRVSLHLGGPKGLALAAAWSAFGSEANHQFGMSVAGVGDVNADGCADFVVGAPGQSSSKSYRGQVYLFLGSPGSIRTNSIWTAMGKSPGELFGFSIAGVGDVDGDGRNDLLVGAPHHMTPDKWGVERGRACLFLGVPGGFRAKPGWSVEGRNAFSTGKSVSALGDLNGDGFLDFSVNSPRRARIDVFYGSPTNYGPGNTFPANDVSITQVMPDAPVTPVTHSATPAAGTRASHKNSSEGKAAILFIVLLVGLSGIVVFTRHRQRRLLDAERARIARDLHDEIGPRLTQLNLLGERVHQESVAGSRHEGTTAHSLAAEARELAARMDEVVWTLSPGSKSTLEELAMFLGSSGERYFAQSSIRYRQLLPIDLPPVIVSPGVRKHVPLIVKESFSNVVRHSRASEVWLKVSLTGRTLNVCVRDNGRGMTSESRQTAGNGLKNMRSRCAEIGATLNIRSDGEPGTEIEVTIPL